MASPSNPSPIAPPPRPMSPPATTYRSVSTPLRSASIATRRHLPSVKNKKGPTYDDFPQWPGEPPLAARHDGRRPRGRGRQPTAADQRPRRRRTQHLHMARLLLDRRSRGLHGEVGRDAEHHHLQRQLDDVL